MKKQGYLAFILGCSLLTQGTALAAKKQLFNEYVIDSPTKLTHPVYIADVLPQSGKELITLGIDKDNQSWLIIYQQKADKSGFEISDQLPLDKSISRFDISEYHEGHHQQIYFMNYHQLMVYQAANNSQKSQLHPVTQVNSLFLDENPQYIAKQDFISELTTPGTNHLISPHFTGLAIYDAQGNQIDNEQVTIKPQIAMGSSYAEFTQKPTFNVDVNFDGKKDIVMAGEGELIAYTQNKSGGFSKTNIKVNQSISGINWWDKRDAAGDNLDQTNLIYRTLERIIDVNGDNVADLVVKYTQSSGVLDRANDFEFFYGQRKGDKILFKDQPDTIIKGEGTLTDLRLIDINNDNKLEVMLSGFDIGVSQIISALLSGSVEQDIYLYKLDANNNFDEDADVEKEAELNFSITSGQSGTPVVKLLDINNDGLKDLLISSGEKTLKVYYGEQGKRIFSRRSKRHKTVLPKNGRELEYGDINNDGKEDIVFKYGRLDGDDKRKKIRVLLTK